MCIKAYLLVLACTYVAVQSYNVTNDVGVYGGVVISIEDAPFMAIIFVDGHLCGGSIIHENFILTAAHCIYASDLNVYNISLGAYRRSGGSEYKVKRVIVHEKFNKDSLDYDIGLLQLTKTITFTSSMSKIDLANETTVLVNKTDLNVFGWGETEYTRFSFYLQKATVPYIDFVTCKERFQKFINISPIYKLTPRMFCAGARGKNSCKGDSGGPIIFNNVQVGITSKGIFCSIYPGVYTNVSLFTTWIQTKISENLQ